VIKIGNGHFERQPAMFMVYDPDLFYYNIFLSFRDYVDTRSIDRVIALPPHPL